MSLLKNLTTSIKNYKFHSLFVRNFIIILLVVMIPLDILSLFFYRKNNDFMYQEIYQTNKNYSYTVRNIADTVMKETQTLTINTALLDKVMNYVINKPSGDSAVSSTLIEYCNSYTNTLNHLHSIYIYSHNSDTILTDYGVFDFTTFSDTQWYEEYLSINQEKTKIITRAKNNYYPYLLTIIHPIFATDVDKMGAVIVNINIQELTDIFHSLDMNTLSTQKFYITDDNNRIIYSDEQDEILQNLEDTVLPSLIFSAKRNGDSSFESDDTTYMFSDIKSQFFDWHYYCIVPMTSFDARAKSVTLYLLIMMSVSLIISIFGAFYLSIRTFRPIENILELINAPSNEQKNRFISPDTYKNESTYILNHISKTLATNEQLKEELDMRLMLLKHSQIVVLQSQINPHFLFNTLDTINWMAIDAFDGENNVSEALTILGKLFKLNIDTSDYLTTLKSELDYTKQYTKILKIRHKDIFDLVWNIDEGLDSYIVPRLTLQPLVENALYHGIKPKRSYGLIKVSITTDNNNLLIKISDDGVGLEPDRLKTLSEELEQDYIFGGSHVGIKNINQRIKLIYGNEYGTKVQSNSSGTTVTIKIPLTEHN